MPAKLRLIALGIILALLAGMLWLLGTESGTRFVLARAEPYLPAGLELRSASGSFFGDVCLETVNWKSESLDVRRNNWGFVRLLLQFGQERLNALAQNWRALGLELGLQGKDLALAGCVIRDQFDALNAVGAIGRADQ